MKHRQHSIAHWMNRMFTITWSTNPSESGIKQDLIAYNSTLLDRLVHRLYRSL
jgi:hypothetical protein